MIVHHTKRRVWRIGLGLVVLLIATAFAWDSLIGNRFLSFHGRVVDEEGKGIPGVQVHVGTTRRSWATIPFLLWADNGIHEQRVVVTDPDGNFHIHFRGSSLGINGANAPGYYAYNDWIGLQRAASTNFPSERRGRSRDNAVILPMVKGVRPPPKRLR